MWASAQPAFYRALHDEPTQVNKVWSVWLPSKKHHVLEASEAKEHDGRLMFLDALGNIVGKFNCSDLQGYADAGPLDITLVSSIPSRKGLPKKPQRSM